MQFDTINFPVRLALGVAFSRRARDIAKDPHCSVMCTFVVVVNESWFYALNSITYLLGRALFVEVPYERLSHHEKL